MINMAKLTKSNEMKLSDWEKRWDVNSIGFHQHEVNRNLLKHEALILTPGCRVFVPLCGKSLDLVYLADKGHDVYGAEVSEKAIIDFFKEQSIEYEQAPSKSGKFVVYKGRNKKVTLFRGDFFALNSDDIGKFEAIWDRGSLVAINPSQRNEYVEIMKDLVSPNCKYLLNSFEITGDNYQGPPHSVLKEEVKKLFGSFCDVTIEETYKVDVYRNSDSFEVANILIELHN